MNSDKKDNLKLYIAKRKLPSLQALLCFEIAAQEQSFSRAADILCLTHSAVSRAVRLLEETLGIALFERRKKAVHLTESGKELALAIHSGLDQIENAWLKLRQQAQQASLTVGCEPTLMMKWLMPRLPDFQQRYPAIRLGLVAAEGDALDPGMDISIRRDDITLPETIIAEPLFQGQVGPVCRPDKVTSYFHSTGEGLTIAPATPLLHTMTRPDAWENWARRTSQVIPDNHKQSFEHFYYSIQAAIAGMGIAIAPRKLVEHDINNGILAAPLGFIEDGSRYYVLMTNQSSTSQAIKDFCLWLKHEAEKR